MAAAMLEVEEQAVVKAEVVRAVGAKEAVGWVEVA